MAKQISKLYASIYLKDDAFYSAIRNAERSLSKFGRDLSKIGSQLARIFAPLASVASIGGLSYLTATSAEAAIKLGRVADALGISTEKLGAFQFYMKQAGIGTEQTNTWLLYLSKNIGLAALGTGEAALALKKLGLDARELLQIPLDQQLVKISAEIRKLSTSAEKTAVITKVFGENSQLAAALIENWAKKANQAQDQVDKLGLSLSRLQVFQIEKAYAAFERLKSSLTVIGNILAVNLSPFMEIIADKLEKMGNDGSGFGNKIQAAFEKAIYGASILQRTFQGISGLFWSVALGTQAIGTGLLKLYDIASQSPAVLYTGIESAGLQLGETIADTNKSLADKVKTFFSGDGWAGKLAKGWSDSADKLRDTAVERNYNFWKNNKLTPTIDDAAFRTEMDEMYKQLGEQMKVLADKVNESFELAADPAAADRLIEQYREITKKAEDLARIQLAASKNETSAFEQKSQYLKYQNEQLDQEKIRVLDLDAAWKEFIKNHKKHTEALSESQKMVDSWRESFVDFFAGVGNGWKALVNQMMTDIARLIARQALFGKSGSGGLLGGAFASAGNFFSGLLEGRANGGPMNAGQAYITGERGPELIVPRVPSFVIPLNGSGGGNSGGVVINQNITFGDGVNQAAKAVVYSMMPQIMNMTTKAVIDAQRRGKA